MRRKGVWKRLAAGLLALVLVLGNVPGISPIAEARTAVLGGMGVKDADPATVNNWKNVIEELDTTYAGGVWTDKSVFETAEDYLAATDEAESFSMELQSPRDFLISLSAIASTKTVVGYSTLPTDTMFILDVSGSMDSNNRDTRMVQAANKAIGDLLELNNYNRIGVVLYSSDATLLMPLDRYTTTSTTTYNNETIPSFIYLSGSDDVTVSRGVRNSNGNRPTGSREVVGATYIQDGIVTAMNELTDPDLDTVISSGFQAGTTRTPIMVLMSDGAPTYAINSYTDIGRYNMGNGQASSTTADMGFVTQLTASWAKEKVALKYGSEVEPLFYTLGLGVGSDSVALSVMDPNNANASATANGYWNTFSELAEGESMRMRNHTNRWVTKLHDGADDNNDTMPLSKGYVDRYFAAGSSEELSSAFQKIVDTIILQTRYYPTEVEGGDAHHAGYLEFHDYIGPNMEVKDVKGIQLGETLYTGENFARLVATGMGTVENPTEAGSILIQSMINRLNLGEIDDPDAAETARELLRHAWQNGQLAYNVDYDGNVTWSNWVGWYGDENDNYLAPWDGDGIDEDMIGKAAYAAKTYLVLGGVGEGHRETDMLYASFQVRSRLDQNGNVVEDIVYARLPASLIPMLEYNVELDSNDPMTAENITLTRTGVDAPIRLIYEVGLRSRIDILNMEGTASESLKTDADGNYIFYTNQWDLDGLNAGVASSKLNNACVNFYPSEENERYYYHEDTPIYVASGSGYAEYTGTKPAAGDGNTYYHRHVTYTAATNGGAADLHVDYHPIPEAALTAETVRKFANTDTWCVKKGTLHLYEARTSVTKTENVTGTLPYAEHPFIHDDPVMGYHLDGVLGNNGLLTVDPPEGLKLTKSIDSTLMDDGTPYTFNIALTAGSHDNATIYLITETDGVRSDWQEISFTDTYTVEVAAGDCAWLAGLPVGNTYTVTEPKNDAYEPASITVDGQLVDEAVVTITNNHVVDVHVTNSAVVTGDVEIGKQVVSTYAPHLTEDYPFSFAFQLTGAEPNTIYETVLVTGDGTANPSNGIIATDANGYAEFDGDLSHGQSILIEGLPVGAVITAVESQLPGFTSNQPNDTASATVVAGETASVTFVNTYRPEPASPYGIVDVYAKKILEGRDWVEGDSFTFVLEKHVSHEVHNVIEEITVDYFDDDKIADFQSSVSDSFDAVGSYSLRIMEKPGSAAGMAYDTATCYFDIIVEDDGQGQLYVADVIGRQDVEVIHSATDNTWDVIADFINVYNSKGSVQVSLSVTKDLVDPAATGMDKSGFVFEIYDADADFNIGSQPRNSVTTNAEGVANFRDTIFTEEGTYYFVLKEKPGTVPGMYYDPTVYYCTGTVTSDPTTSGLIANGTVVDSNGNLIYNETVTYDPATEIVPTLSFNAAFTNTYEPLNTETAIYGEKLLDGRRLNDGEFTFQLYEAALTDSGFVMGNLIAETVNDGFEFSFEGLDALTYNRTGTYYYAVKEAAGSLGGVIYDEKVVYVTVQVTADLENSTLVVNSVSTTDAQGNNTAMRFTNRYRTAPTSATIEGSKTMTGRVLAADMFQFCLLDASGAVLQTVTNDSNGNVRFTVDYTEAGEYSYTVVERIPGTATNNQLNGVTYDANSWPVTVTVRDNLAGELVAEVSYPEGTPAFANDYTPAPTVATIEGRKMLEGRNQTAGEFSFNLFETDANFVPLDNVADSTAVTYDTGAGAFAFTFGELTYTKAGGYRYIITEQKGTDDQVDYDSTVFYALVTVTDNGSGQLEAAVTVGNELGADGSIKSAVNGIEFYNVFRHTPANLVIGGNKTLQDHRWEEDHVFTFELYEADSSFTYLEDDVPATATNDPTEAGKEGAFAFPELTFEEQGVYYYVVKEQLPQGVTVDDPRDDNTGIVYDTKEVRVTVTVEENPDDPTALKATYTVDGAETVTFNNRYTTEGSVLATISGKKVLTGRNIRGTDSFAFVLKDRSGKEVETVTCNGDGTSKEASFSFQSLSFDRVGTYTYTVEEVAGSVAGVTYSKEVCTVTVEVSSKLGKLTDPVVTYKVGNQTVTEPVFTNSYKAGESDALVLEGAKTLTGGILKDSQFTFELYEAEKNAEGAFVQGKKLDDVTNTGGKFAFDGLTFEAAGEYCYIIREQAGSESGVTYDDNEFYVTVIVEDPGDGKLTAQVDQIEAKEPVGGAGVAFTNVYTPDPISVTFSGTKTLTGRKMTDGEFTFELYKTEADHIVAGGAQPLATTSNAGETFTFPAQELPAVGVYYYAVKETGGTASYVTYDTTVYNITVNVSNNNGVLEKEVIYKVGGEVKTELSFRNTYRKPDPQPRPLDIYLSVEKIMKGRYGADGFTFELVTVNGAVVDTAVSDQNGDAVLHAGTFTKSDAGKTYYFIIREVDTGIPGVLYSSREYQVQITLAYDSANNRMVYQLVKDGAVVSGGEPFVFTNVYNPGGGNTEIPPEDPYEPHDPYEPGEPTSPDTGDEGIGLWITLLSVSTVCLAAVLLVMIRRRRST